MKIVLLIAGAVIAILLTMYACCMAAIWDDWGDED